MEQPHGDTSDRTATIVVSRTLPFMVFGGVVFARRTQWFHSQYLKHALRRPMRQHLSEYPSGTRGTGSHPELEKWLKRSLGEHPRRTIHLISGITGFGRSTTALNYLASINSRGLYLDLLALQNPDHLNSLVVESIIAQTSVLAKFCSPLNLDIRTVLPVALRLWAGPFFRGCQDKPVIVLNHAENLFKQDPYHNYDSSWFLWLMIDASRHADVVVVCNNTAVLQHVFPSQGLTTCCNTIFCPAPPLHVLQDQYSARCPPAVRVKEVEDRVRILTGCDRRRLGARIAELFQHAPAMANFMLYEIGAGRSLEKAIWLAIDKAAKMVSERLGLGRPSAYTSVERAEQLLLRVECLLSLLFGEEAQRSLVQDHDAATRRLIELKFLCLESNEDGTIVLRVREDYAIVWALSSPGPSRTLRSLIRIVQGSELGDKAQIEDLVVSIERQLAVCPDARSRLEDLLTNIDVDDAGVWSRSLHSWRAATRPPCVEAGASGLRA